MAPERRLPVLESLGREEEEDVVVEGVDPDPDTGVKVVVWFGVDSQGRFRAVPWRMAFSEVKYIAEPKPVRRADGRAPRQRAGIMLGEERMSAIATRREFAPPARCWTRVFNRSKGCRSTAESTPEPRPATKWKASWRVG